MERGRLRFGRSDLVDRRSMVLAWSGEGALALVWPNPRRARRAAARRGESRIVITTKPSGFAGRSTPPPRRFLRGRFCVDVIRGCKQARVSAIDIEGLLAAHGRLTQALAFWNVNRRDLRRVAARKAERIPSLPPLDGVGGWSIRPGFWPCEGWLVDDRFEAWQITHLCQAQPPDGPGCWP